MSLTIAEALHQAQQAIDGGDYRSATATCSQLVSQFPGYASAHHLLGEAYREQGQTDDAERAYAAALVRQPRQAATNLGLGLIAEDQGVNEAALAFCQVAWELAPNQSALREPLTRVSLRRYGSDGELQLTHAALAQLHATASRLRRAVGEYRLALLQLPPRLDLQIGLLEVLWRLGDNDEALQLARTIIEVQPECAPALVVLADLEQRSGNTRQAADLLKRLRAVDPDGAIVSGMLQLNANADHEFLTLAPTEIPMVDDQVVAVSPERPKIAPAPDFEYRPTRSEIPTPTIDELAPMSFEEFGAADSPSAEQTSDTADFSFDDLGDLPEGLEPISIEELGGVASSDESFEFSVTSSASMDEDEAEAPAPFTLEEVLQFEAPAPAEPAHAPAPAEDFQLFSEPAAPTASAASAASHEPADVAVDDISSLAASLEEDVAGALGRAGEPVADGVDVEASRPPEETPRGYTTVLQGLENQGFSPFDPRSREPVEGMPSMVSDDIPAFEEPAPDASVEHVAEPESTSQTDHFGKITRDWDTIDDEILAAMPTLPGHGYTEELRSLDEIGLTPFEVEQDDEVVEGVTPFNPFADDQAAPDHEPAPASNPTPPASTGMGLPSRATDELLGGLAPFAFEDFDSGQPPAGDSQPRSFFQQSGWEGSSSAIPSDADLDALLAFEDDDPLPTLDPEPAPAPDDAFAQVADAFENSEPSAPSFNAQEAMPAAAANDESAMTAPNLSDADLNEFFDHSIAVTRQLPGDAAHPMLESDAGMPEPFQPAATFQESEQPDYSLSSSLLPSTEVFARARAVKHELMSEGQILGTRELGMGITTDELVAMEERLRTRNLPQMDVDSLDDDVYDDEDDDLIAGTGATRDTRTLRAALEVTPEDDELRWWLAEALRDRGDLADAYTEYRWLIRNAPHRHDNILEALNESVEHDQMPETAHRLLGDIYRRRGDVTRASNHAALALQVRRRTGRVS